MAYSHLMSFAFACFNLMKSERTVKDIIKMFYRQEIILNIKALFCRFVHINHCPVVLHCLRASVVFQRNLKIGFYFRSIFIS